MSDKPILFSGPMVLALLAGTKTQTRRALKSPKWAMPGCDFELEDDGPYVVAAATGCMAKVPMRIAVGDRLWVKENWSHTGDGVWTIADARSGWGGGQPIYMADGRVPGAKYWPSIHMPREFSRITLHVTDVRVQRLQDIGAGDAMAEGVDKTEHWRPKSLESRPFEEKWWDDATFWAEYPPMAYRELWEAINGAGSWDANPWVAAMSFTVEHRNIGRARAA